MSETCPNTEQLEGFLKGKLPTHLEKSIDKHVDWCARCQKQMDQLLGVDQVVPTSIESSHVQSEALDKMMARMMANGPKQKRSTAKKDNKRGRGRPSFIDPPRRTGYLGRFDIYDVISVIGHGGMGIVLKGHDPTLNRVVAIKVLAPHLASSDVARKRFLREARSVAAVTHDNIAPIYLVSQCSGLPFLVMPLITGGSLQDLIDRSGPLEPEKIVSICKQVARGLGAAHARGLIHRDIKPTNLMLDSRGERVTIVDFGLARCADDVQVTKTGTVAGTPQYMAPEQAMGQRIDHRVDLYSLGAVAYTMCTGRSAFAYPTAIAVIRAVCDEDPKTVRELNDQIPQWLEAIVTRLMEKNPDLRFQTSDEVLIALNNNAAGNTDISLVSGGSSLGTTQPGTGGRQFLTKPYVRWLSAMAVVIFLLALIFLAFESADTTVRHADNLLATEPAQISTPATPQRQVTTSTKPISEPPVAKLIDEPDQPHTLSKNETDGADSGENESPTLSAAPVGVTSSTLSFVIGDSGNPDAPRHTTIEQAIADSDDGGVIEVEGAGVISFKGIVIPQSRLTIRAAIGADPTLVPMSSGGSEQFLLESKGQLILEGLTFASPGDQAGGAGTTNRLAARIRSEPESKSGFVTAGAGLYVINCRFDGRGLTGRVPTCIKVPGTAGAHIRNSEFYTPAGSAIRLTGNAEGESKAISIANCVHAGRGTIHVDQQTIGLHEVTISDSHVAAVSFIALGLRATETVMPKSLLRVHATGNVFDVRAMIVDPSQKQAKLTCDHVKWSSESNLYAMAPVLTNKAPINVVTRRDKNALWDWAGFAGESVRNDPRGRIFYINRTNPAVLVLESNGPAPTVDDFRISQVSSRRRRQENIEGIGVQPQLIGPGRTYDRFRDSGEYRDWVTKTIKAIESSK